MAHDRFLSPTAEVVKTPRIQTSTARRGDLVITADGTSELIPAEEVGLGFLTSGTPVELLTERAAE